MLENVETALETLQTPISNITKFKFKMSIFDANKTQTLFNILHTSS